MARGTFANIRLLNKFLNKQAPQTIHLPSGEIVSMMSVLPLEPAFLGLWALQCLHCHFPLGLIFSHTSSYLLLYITPLAKCPIYVEFIPKEESL